MRFNYKVIDKMLSSNRCLICYCQTDVVTFSAEERVSPSSSPPNDEQICDDDSGTKNFKSEDKEGDHAANCLSSKNKNGLSKDLRAIFTLGKLLQVPAGELASHLSKWGSPGGWISLCSKCNEVVTNAVRIYQQVLEATRILEGMRRDIVGMIKESFDSEASEWRPSGEEIEGILEVTVKTREFVKGYEFGRETICDPFMSGDLRAKELLKMQEHQKFFNGPLIDEDGDLMEVDEDIIEHGQASNILGSVKEEASSQTSIVTPPISIQSTSPSDQSPQLSVSVQSVSPTDQSPPLSVQSISTCDELPPPSSPSTSPSNQSPSPKSDCEVQDDTEDMETVVDENQQIEQPTMSPFQTKPESKPTNTIQLSFNIPKIPVIIQKEQVSVPAKVETSWMVAVRPNIFAKKPEEPKKSTPISKSLESSVPEKQERGNLPNLRTPDDGEVVNKSEMQTLDVEIIQEVQTPKTIEPTPTIKLEPRDDLKSTVKPKAHSNGEVAIKRKSCNPHSLEESIKPKAMSPEHHKEAIISPEAQSQSPENGKKTPEPKTHATATATLPPQFEEASVSKPIPCPPPARTKASSSSSSGSVVDDILGDLDPFVQELLSVPKPKLSRAKASIPVSKLLPSSSVKKPVEPAQIGHSQNNVHHGFDRRILQENGSWRRFCLCGMSYTNSSHLSRHIRDMDKTTVVLPQNANSGPPRKFQCFICKGASPSVIAIFDDLQPLKAHLDQEHHTQIISAFKTVSKQNGGLNSAQSRDTVRPMESKRQLSAAPIQNIPANLKSSLTPENDVIEIGPPVAAAPKLQQQSTSQPPQPIKNTRSTSPIFITTNAIKPSRPLLTTPRKPKNIASGNPIIITTNAIKPSRPNLTKPPTPTKRSLRPRSYVCRHCVGANPPEIKRFNCLAHLTNHIHSVHGGWLCPTPNCEKIFSTWMHLIAHRRKGCSDRNSQAVKSQAHQTEVQVLKTSPITVPTLASSPKNALKPNVSMVERKPIIPTVLATENDDDDDVICIDD